VHVSERGLRKRSPWSRNFEVDWSGVRRVSKDKTWNRIVFETTRGRIRVSNYMDGVDELMKAVPRRG
jgi:hypothetical protein